tara:strand:+ start:410 stop:583 length:174 start_codon:yes stop_codon:yes gene_type:complete
MKKIVLILLILINSCGVNSANRDVNNNIKFNNEMTFNEFKVKLEEYTKSSDYPDIDE